VTYTGAIGKANNLSIALEAAEILQGKNPGIRFLFVGDGPEKQSLLGLLKEKKLNNVEFKDPVSKDAVVNILHESDALFFNLKDSPVFKYGISSNKLFDYLAAGKPVLFSCNAVNNPVSKAGAGITVQPENPLDLSDAVAKLYAMSNKERREMGLKGKRFVKEFYSIPVLVEKLEKVLVSETETYSPV
jgi:glycosyltransferase involved in cell wall biosynthesis